jgi:hypothetical protein
MRRGCNGVRLAGFSVAFIYSLPVVCVGTTWLAVSFQQEKRSVLLLVIHCASLRARAITALVVWLMHTRFWTAEYYGRGEGNAAIKRGTGL